MKVAGSATLHAPREKVWAALNDPAVLVRTIPGCQQLEEVGPDRYRMTIVAGVASVKGSYQGDVALTDQQQPGSFTLRASGAGAPGTVSADVKVVLTEQDGGTRLDYDADAVVGGVVGGVGQRVLTGVAKKTAGEFFKAVDDVLTGVAPAPVTAGTAAAVPGGEAAGPPGLYTAAPATVRGGAPGGPAGADLLKAAALGAVVALLGVLVGGHVARSRRRP
jgi:carbon monoxide dehydrogenase subunit G